MNFKHSKNLQTGQDSIFKIQGACWSANNMRLAVAQADRKIALYDENGEKKDSFSTKPAKPSKNYIIREIAFSPDSTRIAVAQSDCIIFIYKLGTSWAEKKTICNKLEQNCPVTCMIWPIQKMNEIYFGMADGKVKVGLLKSNQSSVLFSADSYVVSISLSSDAKFLFSGHTDGVIMRYNFENSNLQKMVVHTSIPYCLAWSNSSILAAGNDYKIIFYNDIGAKLQTFDYSYDEKLKEFTLCRVSPNGDTIAVGNYNKFFVFLYNSRKQIWEEACIKFIDGLYSVTGLCWKPDGSALVTGNISGSVDIFEACLKKTIFKEKFEITYVSHSQVVIKDLESAKRLVIKPSLSEEITKINIYLDNFVVMFTKESLVLGDLENQKSSEISWHRTGQEKFDFYNQNVCIVYNQGELILVEYEKNEILGYCRTEYIHSNLISVRLNYNNNVLGIGKNQPLKIIAYLIDLNTIYIQDLQTQSLITTITNDSKIDFLELNKNGNKLIFRDRKRHLYLYYIFENKKITLLNYCGYVQWVPNSEVLVAQERTNICVWYNVDDPDKVKIIPVKGDVEEIRRREGKTEVIVEEGGSSNSQIYLLDDGLIAFSTAVDENDLNKSVKILENLEIDAETETHWKTLGKLAIANKNLIVAQRCFAAIGNYPKSNFLKKILKIMEKTGVTVDHPVIEARLLILDKQFNNAENLLLSNNLLDDAIEILNELQKWDESVKLAEKYSHPDISHIKAQYYKWLLNNDQLDKAAELKEREGDFITAIDLYLKGGYPAKAANMVKAYSSNKFDNTVLERIIISLKDVGIHEKVGELLEIMGHYQRSLDAYKESKCYSKAVEIAKKYLPNRTELLEEEWGDYLFDQKHFESAIVHFIEAGAKEKAIEAAIAARKWEKATDLIKRYPNVNSKYYVMIGKHYEVQRKLDIAEKYYLASKEYVNVFHMYVNTGKWDKAESIIKKYMKDEESNKVILDEAMEFEKNGKYIEAEKLYILAGEHDIAISMFKSIKQYDNMIRLVSKYRPDYLKSTHQMVATLLEQDKNLKQAEKHYILSGNWKACVEVYRFHNMFDEALRVAKSNGSKSEVNELAKKWVMNQSKEEQIKTLMTMGLGEACIDILCSIKDYEAAFKLAEQHERYKIPDIHLKYAMDLEDEKRYHDAEEHYVKANQLQEVIQMYEHIRDYQSALRIARQHDPSSVTAIYTRQGEYFLNMSDFSKAEVCFVNAKQPENMIRAYYKIKNFDAAEKFASKYCPQMVNDIKTQKLLVNPNSSASLTGPQLEENAKLNEERGDYIRAIDTYLEIEEKHFIDLDKLEELWHRAVKLVLDHDKTRINEILYLVANKFKNIKKFNQAAILYENVMLYEEAIKCHIQLKNFTMATNLANSIQDSKIKNEILSLIKSSMKQESISNNNPFELISIGDEKGLEMLYQSGSYDACLEQSHNFPAETMNKYLILIVKKFLENKSLSGAVDILTKNKTPIYKYNLELYGELALEILAEENLDEFRALKEMLFSAVKLLPEYPEFAQENKKLSRLHLISYHQFNKFSIKPRKELFPQTYYKLCLAVLAYGEEIKIDLALLDAGIACKEMELKSNAFVLLNRYLDFYELIEDPSIKLEEEKEFSDTHIIQVNPYRSDVNIITPDKKEEIRRWVVSNIVDKSFEKTLMRKPCPKCAKNVFEANSSCKYCGYLFECCVVSGYPIHQGVENVSCTSCGKRAIKSCWREWISSFEQCPWCRSVQMSYR